MTPSLDGYLTQATNSERYWIDNKLSSIVNECISFNENATHGQILGLLMKTLRGKVDGKLLDRYVTEIMTLRGKGN